jgi:hypothetical protein
MVFYDLRRVFPDRPDTSGNGLGSVVIGIIPQRAVLRITHYSSTLRFDVYASWCCYIFFINRVLVFQPGLSVHAEEL